MFMFAVIPAEQTREVNYYYIFHCCLWCGFYRVTFFRRFAFRKFSAIYSGDRGAAASAITEQ